MANIKRLTTETYEGETVKCDHCGEDGKELIKLGVETSGRFPSEEWWCLNCIRKRMALINQNEGDRMNGRR